MLYPKMYSTEYFIDLFQIALLFSVQPKYDNLDYKHKLDRVFRVSVSNILKLCDEGVEHKLEYIENAHKAYEIVKEQFESGLDST
ncbi:hypothetical protein [Ammoniphilus sp. 3BR4]|uniref:hypothetical protein n=1 Tax=Ammoniphilus sp. 3BR4 TaxID=3158265 RepID=UPI003464FB12